MFLISWGKHRASLGFFWCFGVSAIPTKGTPQPGQPGDTKPGGHRNQRTPKQRTPKQGTPQPGQPGMLSFPRLEIDSVIEAIQLSRQGKQVPDRKKIDHDYIFQKALEKGLENIDSSERALLSPDDLPKLNKAREESREKAKAEGIENKLKAMKDSGLQWFKAYKKLNLDRFSKIEQSRLKALYKKI